MQKAFKIKIPLFYLIMITCISVIESENVVLSVKGIKDLKKKKEMKKMLKARLANNCISGTPEPIWEDDTITETFCRCNDGTYGLTCLENFENPCVKRRQYASADKSIAPNYFIECTANIPYLMKCAPGTKWNENIITCDWDYNTRNYDYYKKGNPVEISKKRKKSENEDGNQSKGYKNQFKNVLSGYGNQEAGGLSGYEYPKGQAYASQGGQATGVVSGFGGKVSGVASGSAGNFDGHKGSMNDGLSGYQAQQVYGNQEAGGLSGYEYPKGQAYASQGGQATGVVSGFGGKVSGVASGSAGNFDNQKGSMNDGLSGYQAQQVSGNQEAGGLSGYESPKGQAYASQGGQATGVVSGFGGKESGVASGSAGNFDGHKGSMNDGLSGYQAQQVYGNQEAGGLSGYKTHPSHVYQFPGSVFVSEAPKGSIYSVQKSTELVNDYSKLSPELMNKIEAIKYSFLNEMGGTKFSSKDFISVYDSFLKSSDHSSSNNSPNTDVNSVFDTIKKTFSNSNPSAGGYDHSIQNIYEAFVKNKIDNNQTLTDSRILTPYSENPIEYIKNVISNAKNKPMFNSYQKIKISPIYPDIGNQANSYESDYSKLNRNSVSNSNYQTNNGQEPNNQIGSHDHHKSEKYSNNEPNSSQFKPVKTTENSVNILDLISGSYSIDGQREKYSAGDISDGSLNQAITDQKSKQDFDIQGTEKSSGYEGSNFVPQEKVAFENNEQNSIMNDVSAYHTPSVYGNNEAFQNGASKDQAQVSQGGVFSGSTFNYAEKKESEESSPVQGYQPILSNKNPDYQLNVDSSKLSVQETDRLLKFLLPKITSTQLGHQQFFKIDIPIDKNSQAYCKEGPNGVTIGLNLSFF